MHNRDRSEFHALVAQWIERSPAEAEAVGSSPAKRASDPATLREPPSRAARRRAATQDDLPSAIGSESVCLSPNPPKEGLGDSP